MRVSHSRKPGKGKGKKMKDTYGRSLPLPSMRFDQDSLSWRTCEATSLWDLEMSSPTFPESGMTRDGLLYERPTQALLTAVRDYSSLPTPAARDYKDQSFSPRVLDGRSHGELPEAIGLQFLPTPTVVDMGSSYTPEEWEDWKDEQRDKHQNGNGHGASLGIDWGKYEQAVRRWEEITREAPSPTVERDGRPRLSPVFVEWMMGLEPGHVTGHGLRPAQELKALGNGVCPQQALLALHMLLD